MADVNDKGTTFSIAGGPGRVQYTLAEIVASSRGIGMVGDDLGEIAGTLGVELTWLSDAAEGVGPGLGMGAGAAHFFSSPAIYALRSACRAATAAHAEVAELARHAADAVQRYEEAEANVVASEVAKRAQAARDGTAARSWGVLAPLFMWGQGRKMLHDGHRDGMRDKTEDMLNDAPAYLMGLLGPEVGMWYLFMRRNDAGRANAGVLPADLLRRAFDWSGLARPGHVEVRQVPPAEWNSEAENWRPGRAVPDLRVGVPGVVESSFAGTLSGSRDAYGYPPGSIGVDRLDRPDGSHAWIVHLPGTEDWSTVDSSNPWDVEGDLEGLTAAQSELFTQHQVVVQELIKEALRAAGSLPGEEVMVTGHSGGGIHAAAAAADPAFLAEVNLKVMVIAGAPGRNQKVAPGIDVLDLENEHDVVAAADYGPPPDTPHWVTVTTHRPGAKGGMDDPHSLDNYVDDAAALDKSPDPGMRGLREIVNNFMLPAVPGGSVNVRKFVFQGRDVDGTKREKPAGRTRPATFPAPRLPLGPNPLGPNPLGPSPNPTGSNETGNDGPGSPGPAPGSPARGDPRWPRK